jgi:lysine 2,3-aminomutase
MQEDNSFNSENNTTNVVDSKKDEPPSLCDWKWQLSNRIKNTKDLESFKINLDKNIISVLDQFPVSITPYYLSLIKEFTSKDPIYRMSFPLPEENIYLPFLQSDPLKEEHSSPVENLIHKYKDRALIISTSLCSVNCRHCTRKRVTGQQEFCFTKENLDKWVEYITSHPEIKDVIISGGDPLTMETSKIDYLLSRIRAIESVDIIRIGTRTPVVLPMRITEELVNVLKKYHPLWINTHFNHPNEITKDSIVACNRIADAGIPLGNQSVLLKDINDDKYIMEELCRKLVKMRCRPYYLFSPDKVLGTAHFQTSVETGVNIIEHLQLSVGGLATPTFVVDLADGGGKIPIVPNRVIKSENGEILFKNKIGGTSKHMDFQL